MRMRRSARSSTRSQLRSQPTRTGGENCSKAPKSASISTRAVPNITETSRITHPMYISIFIRRGTAREAAMDWMEPLLTMEAAFWEAGWR